MIFFSIFKYLRFIIIITVFIILILIIVILIIFIIIDIIIFIIIISIIIIVNVIITIIIVIIVIILNRDLKIYFVYLTELNEFYFNYHILKCCFQSLKTSRNAYNILFSNSRIVISILSLSFFFFIIKMQSLIY